MSALEECLARGASPSSPGCVLAILSPAQPSSAARHRALEHPQRAARSPAPAQACSTPTTPVRGPFAQPAHQSAQPSVGTGPSSRAAASGQSGPSSVSPPPNPPSSFVRRLPAHTVGPRCETGFGCSLICTLLLTVDGIPLEPVAVCSRCAACKALGSGVDVCGNSVFLGFPSKWEARRPCLQEALRCVRLV